MTPDDLYQGQIVAVVKPTEDLFFGQKGEVLGYSVSRNQVLLNINNQELYVTLDSIIGVIWKDV